MTGNVTVVDQNPVSTGTYDSVGTLMIPSINLDGALSMRNAGFGVDSTNTSQISVEDRKTQEMSKY